MGTRFDPVTIDWRLKLHGAPHICAATRRVISLCANEPPPRWRWRLKDD
jgi:hypothetical protein